MEQYVQELRTMIGTKPVLLVGATVIIQNEQKEILFQYRSDSLD